MNMPGPMESHTLAYGVYVPRIVSIRPCYVAFTPRTTNHCTSSLVAFDFALNESRKSISTNPALSNALLTASSVSPCVCGTR